MLEATTTVTAEASSMLNPLEWERDRIYGLAPWNEYTQPVRETSLPRGGDWCEIFAHGLDDPPAPNPKPDAYAHSSVQ